MKKKVLIISAGLLVLILLAVVLLPRVFIDGDTAAGWIQDGLGEPFRAEMGDISIQPLRRSVVLSNVVITHADGDTLFTAEKIAARGIGIFAAVQQNIHMNRLQVSGFALHEALFELETDQSGNDDEQDLPDVRINRFSLDEGEIAISFQDGQTSRITGIFVESTVNTRPDECSDCSPDAYFSNVSVAVGFVRIPFFGNRNHFTVESLRFNEREQSLSIAKMGHTSPLSEQDFFRSLTYRSDYIIAGLEDLDIREIDIQKLRTGSGLSAEYMSLGNLDVHVTMDLRYEKDPDTEASTMPMRAFRDLEQDFSVRRMNVDHADIRYSEYAPDGVRTGTIWFASTTAVITDIDNRSEEPAIIRAESMLEDAGKIQVEIRMSADDEGTLTEIDGELGEFDVTLLNRILLDLEGIRIKNGKTHHVDFSFAMNDITADGNFRARYEGLEMEVVDKDDYGQGFFNTLESFVLNEAAVRKNSEENGEEYREGTIDQDRVPEDSFFKYIWVSLRSGIIDVIVRL